MFFGPHECNANCDEYGCSVNADEPGRYDRIQRAKEICHRCVHEVACLTWALDARQRFGVWGGKTERERREILKRRGNG